MGANDGVGTIPSSRPVRRRRGPRRRRKTEKESLKKEREREREREKERELQYPHRAGGYRLEDTVHQLRAASSQSSDVTR